MLLKPKQKQTKLKVNEYVHTDEPSVEIVETNETDEVSKESEVKISGCREQY